jgi:murein DD-endopeptidase MepM/ murein hydrolase activator NlpD
LKASIDRLASRKLFDQDSMEAHVAELLSRQSALETRHAVIARLMKDVGMPALASVKPADKGDPADTVAVSKTPAAPIAAEPASMALGFAPVPKTLPIIEMKTVETRPDAPAPPKPSSKGSADRISDIRNNLDGIASKQIAALGVIEQRARVNAARIAGALRELGLELPKTAGAMPESGVGGPFLSLDGSEATDSFAETADRVGALAKRLVSLRRTVSGVPVRRPVTGGDLSSGFGARVDPFTRGMAFHSGLDFRAPSGTPVRASGSGVVIAADYRGGYGKTVEIDHGNGVTTRYAHLSHIAVEEGQKVANGAILGHVGSTGRSTGPHLHFETRIKGNAADPSAFLRIGRRYQDIF